MDRHTLRKALPYLLPSAAGTAVFYAAPFLVMLVYALSAGSVPEVLSGHALAAGARSTAVFLSCGGRNFGYGRTFAYCQKLVC